MCALTSPLTTFGRAYRKWYRVRQDIRAYKRFPETEDEIIPFDPTVWGDEDWSDVYEEWLAEQEQTQARSLWRRLLRR
jgi:hypothetical protein